MRDSTLGSGSWPGGLVLPLEKEQLEAARTIVADNKGALWAAGQALVLLVGDSIEFRRAIGAFLWEWENVPTSTISDMTGYSGRELRKIVEADSISMFGCLSCEEPIMPRDRRHLMSLKRELRTICSSRIADEVVSTLLCSSCSWGRVQLLEEEKRLRRLAGQARTCQLKKMPFAEYRLTPEWQCRRYQALSRAGYRCQTCGTQDSRLDVHHNTYDHYGDQRPQDLVALCERCHGLFHGRMQDAS